MLSSGDEHAFFHQAGGVTHFGDVAAVGFDLIAIEVLTTEDDSCAGWGGQNAQRNARAAM